MAQSGDTPRGAIRSTITDRTDLMLATRDTIVALLKEAQTRILGVLGAQPSDYQRWYLPQLNREIGAALEHFGETAAASMSGAVSDAWMLGQDMIEAPLNTSGLRVTAMLPHIDTRQLTAMRAFQVDRIKDIGVQAASRISTEMGLVVVGSQTPSDAIGSVTQILGEPSRARATTIVRTGLGGAYNTAAFERLTQSAALVPGLKKAWLHNDRAHPRLHHLAADGQVQDVDQPFILHPMAFGTIEMMFPHDPSAPAGEIINCGCLAVPWKEDWAQRGSRRA